MQVDKKDIRGEFLLNEYSDMILQKVVATTDITSPEETTLFIGDIDEHDDKIDADYIYDIDLPPENNVEITREDLDEDDMRDNLWSSILIPKCIGMEWTNNIMDVINKSLSSVTTYLPMLMQFLFIDSLLWLYMVRLNISNVGDNSNAQIDADDPLYDGKFVYLEIDNGEPRVAFKMSAYLDHLIFNTHFSPDQYGMKIDVRAMDVDRNRINYQNDPLPPEFEVFNADDFIDIPCAICSYDEEKDSYTCITGDESGFLTYIMNHTTGPIKIYKIIEIHNPSLNKVIAENTQLSQPKEISDLVAKMALRGGKINYLKNKMKYRNI